jgi:hypothetical protein
MWEQQAPCQPSSPRHTWHSSKLTRSSQKQIVIRSWSHALKRRRLSKRPWQGQTPYGKPVEDRVGKSDSPTEHSRSPKWPWRAHHLVKQNRLELLEAPRNTAYTTNSGMPTTSVCARMTWQGHLILVHSNRSSGGRPNGEQQACHLPRLWKSMP